ncbi:MAG: GNAT family N-acetyltransferase [Lachnospiraceae bacterium]|jgi:ribosomal-protein-alanine N-acetyltransferase|nr:GNAT family N-acetyltransferase [Lachnospiraceae bacterium]
MKEFVLREWRKEDEESLVQAANNPNIAANLRNVFPYPYSLEDARWYIGDCISRKNENQISRAIEVDGTAVGSISILVREDVYEKSAELGYWLSEDYWGQGIMTRAVGRICMQAFERFDIVRIFAEPFEDNEGSQRVLQKAGFIFEGTMRDGIYKNGKIHSYCMYSLLRREAELLYGR